MSSVPIRLAPTGLPIEDVMPGLRAALAGSGAAVVQAEPGAGKSTIVPLRLLGEPWQTGRILVLEPRRVAARAVASRMAALIGEEVGATVGYVTRDERRVGRDSQIEVITDGILTRRLQREPALSGVALVVFDEFHERHLQGDLGLALTLEIRQSLRPDLRLLVMSATLDAVPLAALLGGAPLLASRGRSHPVAVRWRPSGAGGQIVPAAARAVLTALEQDQGDVLAFLPGVGEIRGTTSALDGLRGVDVVPLHGSLSAAEQDVALHAGGRRRVVLATDLAETSLTVEGVGVVVDAGWARRPVFDPTTGLTRLRTVPTSRASADQRAGRAGRTGPGVAYRLWSEREHLSRRAWPDPEVTTVELASLALELALWGAPAGALSWLDPPPSAGLALADQLLETLGALEGGRPTALGRQLAELPLHPRLGAMLLAAEGPARKTAALLAALLSERDVLRRGGRDSWASADVAPRLAILKGGGGDGSAEIDRAAVSTVRRRAGELLRRVDRATRATKETASSVLATGAEPGPLLAVAYPDRLAQRRGPGRYRLRFGGGAVLPDHHPLASAPWLVAAEVEGADGGTGRADGRIRLAAALDRADLEYLGARHLRTETRVAWDQSLDDVRATTERRLDALVLDTAEGPAPPGADTVAVLVAQAVRTGLVLLGWTPAARALQTRVGFARQVLGEDWPDLSDVALAATAEAWLAPQLGRARGRADLGRIDPGTVLAAALGPRRAELDRLLPATLELPEGRTVPID